MKLQFLSKKSKICVALCVSWGLSACEQSELAQKDEMRRSAWHDFRNAANQQAEAIQTLTTQSYLTEPACRDLLDTNRQMEVALNDMDKVNTWFLHQGIQSEAQASQDRITLLQMRERIKEKAPILLLSCESRYGL